MPTPQKEAILKDTQQRIADVRGFYLADFSGMTVESLSLLRKRCREQGVQFRVIKNTLLKRAFNERGIRELDEHFVGPTGLVFSPGNEMAPAKILSDFAKEFERPRVKAAVVDGRLAVADGAARSFVHHAPVGGGVVEGQALRQVPLQVIDPVEEERLLEHGLNASGRRQFAH